MTPVFQNQINFTPGHNNDNTTHRINMPKVDIIDHIKTIQDQTSLIQITPIKDNIIKLVIIPMIDLNRINKASTAKINIVQ